MKSIQAIMSLVECTYDSGASCPDTTMPLQIYFINLLQNNHTHPMDPRRQKYEVWSHHLCVKFTLLRKKRRETKQETQYLPMFVTSIVFWRNYGQSSVSSHIVALCVSPAKSKFGQLKGSGEDQHPALRPPRTGQGRALRVWS